MIRFIVPGPPVGKERPQFGKGRTYTAQRTVDYEALVADYAAARRRHVADMVFPLRGPVEVTIVWSRQITASWTKKHKAEALAQVWATGTPDLDNVAKSITDAMNGVIYADDSQIAKLTVSRVYTEQPDSVLVEVEEMR